MELYNRVVIDCVIIFYVVMGFVSVEILGGVCIIDERLSRRVSCFLPHLTACAFTFCSVLCTILF